MSSASRSGGDGQDGRPPRPADQVPGRWSCERRLTGARWTVGWEWECPRCTCAAGSTPCVAAGEPRWGVSENTATFMPERLRGAMARPECLNVLSGEVKADDFFLAARDRTRRRGVGRGTDQAADARGGRAQLGQARGLRPQGRPGLGGASWGAFASGHVDRAAHVRADGWPGPAPGPGAWDGLDQRKFDANGLDASLPAARHVISNFKSWATGTFHGLSTAGLRAYADEFSRIFALRVRRHDGPDRRLLPGVLPPRPAARGGLRPQPPAAPARGRPRRGRRPDILRP